MTDEHPGTPRKSGNGPAVTEPTASDRSARRARLAAALRANLHRRKAQARARRPAAPGSPPEEG